MSLACTYRQNCAHINDIQVLYFEICILSIVAKYIYIHAITYLNEIEIFWSLDLVARGRLWGDQ